MLARLPWFATPPLVALHLNKQMNVIFYNIQNTTPVITSHMIIPIEPTFQPSMTATRGGMLPVVNSLRGT